VPFRITPQEWRWVIALALLTSLLTSLPYAVGMRQAGSDWLFNGFLFGVDDGNAYLGKIHLGVQGEWDFHLFYTSEPHEGVLGVYLPFILIGQILRALGQESPSAMIWAWQVWRMLACFGLLLAMYPFIALFLRQPRQRLWALFLATYGGGLGWVLILAGQTNWLGSNPIEFYIPEGFSFLALYGLPHIAMARAALLLGFVALVWAIQQDDWRYAVLAGVLWLIVGLMVTFYWAVLYVLLAVWGGLWWWRTGRWPATLVRWGGLAVSLTLPLFLYSAWAFSRNSAFAEWSAQNYLPSPHPLHYAVGYAVWAGLALVGGRWAWQGRSIQHYLLVAWPIAALVMVYLPLNVQRRMAEGVLLPLSILAVAGLGLLQRPRLNMAVVGLLLPSTLLLWLGTSLIILSPSCSLDVCLYRPQAEQHAMQWLADHAESEAVVLSAMRTGNYLPIQTDLRPFLGLGTETLDSQAKTEQALTFYRGQAESGWLAQAAIDYIWWGPLEREWSGLPEPNPPWSGQTRLLYDRDGYQIYEVLHHAP
jgi:hypothetical protein